MMSNEILLLEHEHIHKYLHLQIDTISLSVHHSLGSFLKLIEAGEFRVTEKIFNLRKTRSFESSFFLQHFKNTKISLRIRS